jgi:vancomycin resistance protein YoaR
MQTSFIKIGVLRNVTRVVFWFLVGVLLALFLSVSFIFIIFQKQNVNVVYPGITVGGISLGGKTEQEVSEFFASENATIDKTQFVFLNNNDVATVSAREINYGYDQNLIAKQAIAIGRTKDVISNISLIFQAYMNGVDLPPAYHYDESKLLSALYPIIQKIQVDPVNAVFAFQNGRVTTFKQSQEGQTVNLPLLKSVLDSKFIRVLKAQKPQAFTIQIPIMVLKPNITTEKVNNLGIKELLSTGTSLFQHSIPNRIYNIKLAAERLNGILVKPGETFSFNKVLGDVSAFTGYQQAYIIKDGKTILGDGGGVCQVSTTLFRALLNAGLPIVERYAHAYRVSYYEQDSPPGLDATVYSPTVDLKFKNDTNNHILIQTSIDPNIQELKFSLYGTKDGREVALSKPIITNQIQPPEDSYQDDPTLPKGTVKQIDFSAWGARVTFTREVIRNNKIIISETYRSNYRPWQAIYLRGTKE